MGERSARTPLAIVGGESLLGRELRDVLSSAGLPARIRLIGAADEVEGILTEHEGEPVIMSALDEENLAGARIVLLAGPPASSHKAYRLVSSRPQGPVIIDLTNALEDLPEARLRAPLLEITPGAAGRVHVVAHPAATAIALLLTRLQRRHPIARSVILVFEPASERGQKGLDELQKQSVCLLSFQKLPQDVFDAQLGFNMLVRYGTQAPEKLEDFECRIDRHLATLLSWTGGIRMPSLRLLQAPVFHGYSISAWVEFEENPGAEALGETLASAVVEVRSGRDVEPPTNVGAAGQTGITVGAIEADRNNPRASWFWVVADNLRLVADSAVDIARQLLEETAC